MCMCMGVRFSNYVNEKLQLYYFVEISHVHLTPTSTCIYMYSNQFGIVLRATLVFFDLNSFSVKCQSYLVYLKISRSHLVKIRTDIIIGIHFVCLWFLSIFSHCCNVCRKIHKSNNIKSLERIKQISIAHEHAWLCANTQKFAFNVNHHEECVNEQILYINMDVSVSECVPTTFHLRYKKSYDLLWSNIETKAAIASRYTALLASSMQR